MVSFNAPPGIFSARVSAAFALGLIQENEFREITEYEPNRKVKATSTSGSFPITFTRMVEPSTGGTKVMAIIEGDASGFFKLAEPLLARMVKRSVDSDYRNLKRILEKRDT